MKKILRYLRDLDSWVSQDKRVFLFYTALRIIIVGVLVRSIIRGQYENAMLCILSLLLFFVPAFLEKSLQIDIPALFEIIIYLFIFAAEILGEINHYYVLIPGWDTILHTLNGFLCAAIGFSMLELLNNNSKNIKLSPFYLSLVAFCFSMTIGVLWEFFEFGMDYFFLLDMQKDFVVKSFGSVSLDTTGLPVLVKNIEETIIRTEAGREYVISGGYLDIGILDTMKDLIVNFIGAIVMSIFGYIYEKTNHKKENLAAKLKIRKLS